MFSEAVAKAPLDGALGPFRQHSRKLCFCEHLLVGVSMIAHNWGKEMAEKPHAQFYFPPGFQILAINPNPFAGQTTVGQQPQNPLFNYPGYQIADMFYEELHEDMLMILSLQLVMPSVVGRYVVPVFV